MAKGIWGSEWPPWLYYRKMRQQRFGSGGSSNLKESL